MPAFKSKLSPTEIQQVAAFVSTAAGTGRAGKISFEPNDQKVEDCTDTACYEQAFGNLAYDDGPKKALEELDKLSATNGTVAADCHPIAHKIGAGGLLHYKGDVGKAFADGSATCGSGYYHGLLQWKLAGVRADQVAGIASTVCKDPKIEANAFIYYQCNHGLGHGLMLYTGLDLPAGARLLPQAADRDGLGHVQRRRLHGEPELVLRAALEVAEQEEPALPLQQQVREAAGQALLLPARHLAHPPVRPRQLEEDLGLVPEERPGLGAVLLPVAAAATCPASPCTTRSR